MLGSPCSPCCSQCKPSEMPDYIEVDIQSSNEDSKYGFLRFRTGKSNPFQFPQTCEQEIASAQKIYGVSSGTYTLYPANIPGVSRFSYSSRSIGITVDVRLSGTAGWPGPGNKSGPGIFVEVAPVSVAGWSKRWPACSSMSAEVPTESDLDSISNSRNFTENGIANTTSLSIGNGYYDRYYAYAISACFGGNEVDVYTKVPTSSARAPTIMVRSQATVPSLLPLRVDASTIFSSINTTDDYNAILAWNDAYTQPCCKFFPGDSVLLLDARGYEITSETTSTAFSNNGVVIPFRFRFYAMNITRTLTITGIRGRASDGRLIELVNNPLP